MYWMMYGIYILVSILLITFFYRKSWQEWLIRVIMVAVLPVVGWLLPLFWSKLFTSNSKEAFEDYVTRQQEEHKIRRIGVYKQVERKQELDVIPIEEALLVSEHQTRRKVMIDVLKQDAINYLEILQRAVSNEDTETSHYAVSAIMETKRKLQLALQDLAVKFETDSSDLLVVRTYAEVLHAYMRSGFLDERTLLKNRYTYLAVLNQYIKLDESSEWAYQEKIELEIVLQAYSDAERSAKMYMEQFPDSEAAYLCMLKVYYVMKSYPKLNETLDRLKRAPISLSNHALTMVRFWSEGA
ncbi:hypothetical protein [Paenibacillus sp. IITD108]|uniref:hypothetical protein n=1 Tax=Paenibacillus sp. IITD108 TaxID=3116649 RepID=UPI002F3E91EF